MTTYEDWVRRLGLGFHPDNRGEDYDPPLTAAEAADYDAAVDAAFARGDDPCERAMAVWRAQGLI